MTYNELYAQYLKGEITPEQWNKEVQKFFDELLELNKNVLVRLKNV